MTNLAERVYTLAARAYPPSYHAEHGDELVATACELRCDRVSLREALSLVIGGMRTRSRVATTGPGAGMWVSGLRLGLVFFAISQLIWTIAPPPEWPTNETPLWVYAMSIAMVAALTIGTGLWYAAFATVVNVGVWAWSFSVNWGGPPWWFALPTVGLLAMVWWLALKTDGRRAISPVGAVVVTVAWWAAFTIAPGMFFSGLVERTGNVLVLMVLALIGLVVISIDPRLMAGATTFFVLNAMFPLMNNAQAVGLRWIVPQLLFTALVLGGAWLAVRRGSRQLHQT